MANQTGVDDIEALVHCEFPGCVHRMRYSGRGRPPRYCGQSVDGLVHTRLTAHRLSKGEISLPTTDSGRAEGERGVGEQGYTDPEPVTSARLTLEQLLTQVHDRVAEHETHMGALAARIELAAATASDPDAAAAEVTAAHREARTQVDAAESERDTALAARLDAERRAEQAQAAQASAESARGGSPGPGRASRGSPERRGRSSRRGTRVGPEAHHPAAHREGPRRGGRRRVAPHPGQTRSHQRRARHRPGPARARSAGVGHHRATPVTSPPNATPSPPASVPSRPGWRSNAGARTRRSAKQAR